LIKLSLLECAAEQSRADEALGEEYRLSEMLEEAFFLHSLNESHQGLVPQGNAGDDILKQEEDLVLLIDCRRL
jgi:hypothetical protein